MPISSTRTTSVLTVYSSSDQGSMRTMPCSTAHNYIYIVYESEYPRDPKQKLANYVSHFLSGFLGSLMIMMQCNAIQFNEYLSFSSSLVGSSMSKLKLGPQESEESGEWTRYFALTVFLSCTNE